MRAMSWAIGIAMLAIVSAGCATTGHEGAEDKEYVPPTSIFSILDASALVYTDPAAGSTVNDHPLRWLGFIAHPFGHAFDYGINRPMYTFGGSKPYFFGYTAEDAMQDSLRR
jgi:hypothetical protein